jgi:ribosomal protein S12 methylthiotransferase accessory factor
MMRQNSIDMPTCGYERNHMLREKIDESDVNSEGIAIDGTQHARVKISTNNYRLRSSSESLELIKGILPIAGVTRLANITGLDRIGIPVALAIRPCSRGVSSSAGKGIRLSDAYLSAAMEALERFHAEASSADIRHATHEEVSSSYSVIPLTELPVRRHCKVTPNWPHDWVLAWDLIGQKHAAVPLSMINLASCLNPYDFPVFQSTSVGLAAGGDLLEALFEGLLEVVEHDSVTCDQYKELSCPTADIQMSQLSPISDPIAEVLQCLQKANVLVFLKDCTSDIGIPVFEARLFDNNQTRLGNFVGHAAHLNAQTAAIKAILEAVQSRAVYISGSRDDYFRRRMNLSRVAQARSDTRPATTHEGVRDSLSRNLETKTLQGDIKVILHALRRANITQALFVDLNLPWTPVSIVKVLVPGLEGPTGDGYRRRQRAQRYTERNI